MPWPNFETKDELVQYLLNLINEHGEFHCTEENPYDPEADIKGLVYHPATHRNEDGELVCIYCGKNGG